MVPCAILASVFLLGYLQDPLHFHSDPPLQVAFPKPHTWNSSVPTSPFHTVLLLSSTRVKYAVYCKCLLSLQIVSCSRGAAAFYSLLYPVLSGHTSQCWKTTETTQWGGEEAALHGPRGVSWLQDFRFLLGRRKLETGESGWVGEGGILRESTTEMQLYFPSLVLLWFLSPGLDVEFQLET